MKRIKRYKKSNSSIVTQLFLVFKRLYTFDKKLILILFLEIAISSASPFPSIIFAKNITDELIKGENYNLVLLYVGLMFSINYLFSVVSTFMGKYKMTLSLKMTDMLANDVRKKCMEMDYEMFNDTATRDRVTHAMMLASNNSFINLLNSIKGLVSSTIILVGVVVIVINLDLMLLIIALFIIAAQCVIHFLNTKNNMNMDAESSTTNRCLNYVTRLTMQTKIKKDISVYNIKDFILGKIQEFQQSWLDIYKKRTRANTLSEWLTTTFSLGFQLAAYLLIGAKVFAKEMTIGSFTMGINSLNTFMSSTRGIAQNIIDINARIFSVSRYNSFLNIRSEFRKNATRSLDGIDLKNIEIEFVNVYFKYPGSTEYVLKDVNLKIDANEKLAVVGENGAGKTTFIMLLTRMYDPTKGKILVNGIDIREIEYDSYMKLFSTVYQDFQIFPFSILENIVFQKEADEETTKKVMELIEKNGLGDRIKSMYQGLDTPITKELDNRGEDLSGGEVQRIAIIRALSKNAPIIILDEPTAALDPNAEYEIYHQFSQMTHQKTAIYISHRIASTRFCDRIAVFEKGGVAELGTFDELIEKKGLYYDFYQKQAEYFKT